MANSYIRDVLLVGTTGTGKSSLGNSLIGEKCFEVLPLIAVSVTQRCETKFNYNVFVTDTPGLLDTDRSVSDIALEILSALNTSTRLRALLIVYDSKRITQNCLRTIHLLSLIFGEQCFSHAIVVFTCIEDEVSESELTKFWKENEYMKEFVGRCGGRMSRIDNKGNQKKISEQVKHILDVVDQLSQNGNNVLDRSFKKVHEDIFKQQQKRNALLSPNRQRPYRLTIREQDTEIEQIEAAFRNHCFRRLVARETVTKEISMLQIVFGSVCIGAGIGLHIAGKRNVICRIVDRIVGQQITAEGIKVRVYSL